LFEALLDQSDLLPTDVRAKKSYNEPSYFLA